MTISLFAALSVLLGHYLGDFELQSDKMATQKSTSNKVLATHVTTYMVPVGVLLMALSGSTYTLGLLAVAGNWLAHFCTDWLTSRATAIYHAEGKRHEFFVVIGLDQLIHTCTLLFTLYLLGA